MQTNKNMVVPQNYVCQDNDAWDTPLWCMTGEHFSIRCGKGFSTECTKDTGVFGGGDETSGKTKNQKIVDFQFVSCPYPPPGVPEQPYTKCAQGFGGRQS